MIEDTDARVALSEMIEITEYTIDQTFHRHPDLAALYRDCPTAFWLAPDGNGVLPPAAPGPVVAPIEAVASPALIEPALIEPALIEDDPMGPPTVYGMPRAIVRALLVAGPTFAATGMMLDRAEFDDHWWDPLGRALVSLVAAPLTIMFGALIASLPVLIGVLALGEGGRSLAALRRPASWTVTGGLMGMVIAALFQAGGTAGLALVATSVACAAMARTGIAWHDPEPA